MIERTSKEIGEEIRRHEKEYEQYLIEAREEAKEHDRSIAAATNSYNEEKREAVLCAKKSLEELHIVPEHKIIARLIKDYKGYVKPSEIRAICEGVID